MKGALALVGPTATGKSRLAMALARQQPGTELVSVDSMCVYRGMEIGTAAPTPAERAEVRHHLVAVVEPTDEFTLSDFQRLARSALADIDARHGRAVLVGGTGLYLRAVVDDLEIPGRWPAIRATLEGEPDTAALWKRLDGVDPDAAGRMEPTNRRRVIRALEVAIGSGRPFSSFGPGLGVYPPVRHRLVGLRLPREVLDAAIRARVGTQLEAGWREEAARLCDRPLSRSAGTALGYPELFAHLRGEIALSEVVEAIVRRTSRFARRQERWFRRDPRIRWIDLDRPIDADNLVAVLTDVLSDFEQCT